MVSASEDALGVYAVAFSSCVENIWGPGRVSSGGLLPELDGMIRVSEVLTFVCHV